MGRFSVTIGYLAPTPNHVHIHQVQQSEIEFPYSSVCMCAMNKMFEVEPPQGHKPRIPQGKHLGEKPTEVDPHFSHKTTHTHMPLPTTGPKKASRSSPLTPAPRICSPYCHVLGTAHQILPLPAVLSHPRMRSWPKFSRQIATAPSSLEHTVCAHDFIVYHCVFFR